MVPRMKRRLPNRIANSLPHTLAHTPSSPITLATVAGARAVHAPAALWAAANVRNVTTHARRADVFQVWTEEASEYASVARLLRRGQQPSNTPARRLDGRGRR